MDFYVFFAKKECIPVCVHIWSVFYYFCALKYHNIQSTVMYSVFTRCRRWCSRCLQLHSLCFVCWKHFSTFGFSYLFSYESYIAVSVLVWRKTKAVQVVWKGYDVVICHCKDSIRNFVRSRYFLMLFRLHQCLACSRYFPNTE